MINPQLARSLGRKLPLIVPRMSIDDLILLKHKWGGVDNLYHSINHIINVAKFETTKDHIIALEDEAIVLIEEELNILFNCPECRTDLRKCGVIFTETCISRKNIYINNDGFVSRSNEEKIIPKDFNGHHRRIYHCVNCNYCLSGRPVEAILEDGINKNTIRYYISRCYPEDEQNLSILFNYRGQKNVQESKSKKILDDMSGQTTASSPSPNVYASPVGDVFAFNPNIVHRLNEDERL